MSDDRHVAPEQALDRYWDALTAGDHARPDALDPATASAVRRLHARGSAPPPVSSRERVRRGVMATVRAHDQSGKESTVPIATPLPRHATTRAIAHQAAASAPRRAVARPLPSGRWLAAVAVVVAVALPLAILASGAWRGSREEKPRTIPAAFASAAGPETVLQLVVPAGTIPDADKYAPIIEHVTVVPDKPIRATSAMGACCPGVQVDYMLSGSATYRSDAPAGVSRDPGSGAWEPVPAGTEITLHDGEAYWRRSDAGWQMTNLGSEDVQLLHLILTANTYPSWPPGWNWHNYHWAFPAPSGPLGELEVTVRRQDLAAGAEVAAPPAGDAQATLDLDISAGANIFQGGDGAARNNGDAPATVYVLVLHPSGALATPPSVRATPAG
jgi:hypothetical protein